MSQWFVLHCSLAVHQQTGRRIHAWALSQSQRGAGLLVFWSGANKTFTDGHVCKWVWRGPRQQLSQGLVCCRLQLLQPWWQTLYILSFSREGCQSLQRAWWNQNHFMNCPWLTQYLSSPAEWAPSGERRSRGMQHDAGVGKSRRCFTSWPRSCLCPTASAPAWTRRPSWDSPSATCAWGNCSALVSICLCSLTGKVHLRAHFPFINFKTDSTIS